jgi:hypothetical protein
MEEKTIQSVQVMPFALMSACISAVIGLILGIIYAATFGAILTYITSSLPATSTAPSNVNFGLLSAILGVGAIVVFPILYFIVGLIGGLICAAVYNFLAPRIGGIKLRFKEEYRVPPQQ